MVCRAILGSIFSGVRITFSKIVRSAGTDPLGYKNPSIPFVIASE